MQNLDFADQEITASNLLTLLVEIGAIHFGFFEGGAPVKADFGIVPSHPQVLARLGQLIAQTMHGQGTTHLLPMPEVIPHATAAGLHADIPLVYPAGGHILGAYDFSVPTTLLTAVLGTAAAEEKIILSAQKDGLHVEQIIALMRMPGGTGLSLGAPLHVLFTWDMISNIAPTDTLRTYVQTWAEHP
jgi:hypothetical protein